jgi:hypothetical protein
MIRLLRRRWPLAAAFALTLAMIPGTASAESPYFTPEDPLLDLDPSLPSGAYVKAIVSSGETVDGTLFEGIPDGVGIRPGPYRNTIDVYVAHEQTTVPFFGSADFVDASVTKWTLDTNGPDRGGVLAGDVAISSDNGYLRFCSASMAGPAEGFDDYVFFTGEEANDVVDIVPGQPFSPDPALTPQRQAGYAVALNTDTGEFDHITGMGRLNHENTIALPGYDDIALVTTDDTFDGPSAQLYMYLADDQDAVFADEGTLWAFQVTATDDGTVDPGDAFNNANDYLDIRPGDDWQGRFIPVPDDVADGTLADVGPQDGLEDWSNDNNVFQFIRLEDLAYDKNDPHVVYIADTGRSRVVPDPATGRLTRGPSGTVGFADNGSVFKMEFDADDPTKVASFSVLAQGDDETQGAYVPFVSPDNLGTSKKSLMVQEDADNAKIWQYDMSKDAWRVVATVNDPDGESSGIVDASQWFGQGTWLLTVQGHGNNVAEEQIGDVLFKRESGQLLLLKIPAS